MELYHSLVTYWPIMFETTKIKRTGKSLTTFSEFTESYLLPAISQNSGIHIALVATLKHLLIDTNVLNMESILKLFMDYLTLHFGQLNAYTSVQSILENILEAYFYRICIIRGYSNSLGSTSQAYTRNSNNRNDQLKSNNNNNDSLCSQASTFSEKSNLSGSTNNTNTDNSSYVSRFH